MRSRNAALVCALALCSALSCSDDAPVVRSPVVRVPQPQTVPTRPYVNKTRTYFLALRSSGGASAWRGQVDSLVSVVAHGGFELVNVFAPTAPIRCLDFDPQSGYKDGGVIVVDLVAPNDAIKALGFQDDMPTGPFQCQHPQAWRYAFRADVQQDLPERREVALPCVAPPQCPWVSPDSSVLYYLAWDILYVDSRVVWPPLAERVIMDLIESGVALEQVWVPVYPTWCDTGPRALTAIVVQVPAPDPFLDASQFFDETTMPSWVWWNCAVGDYWWYCFSEGDCPIEVAGVVTFIYDNVPAGGGVLIDLELFDGGTERLVFSPFYWGDDSEERWQLYTKIQEVEPGDRVAASGRRTKRGIELEDIIVLSH